MESVESRMGGSQTGSPPPRFSEAGSVNHSPTPRFTEHFNNSPPYTQFSEYDAQSAPIPRYEQPDGPLPQHRLSNKERSLSPTELVSPFPEAYTRDEEEKEVAIPPAVPDQQPSATQGSSKRKRICGIPLLWLFVIIGVIVALAIGLGVGLGVGLKNNGSSSNKNTMNDTYAIGGYISPDYLSKSGAFNGTGIAIASESFAKNLTQGTQGTVTMYFQHWTGDIRWMQLSNQGQWVGGDVTTVVVAATDAKNSTPLSAVSYTSGTTGASTWHIFYINQNNTLRQKTNSNVTNVWVDGPINDLNLKVVDADMAGMQACWYGNDYGDSDYTHSPLPNGQVNQSSNVDVGMHMWFASDNQTFQQYGWREGEDDWEYQATFNDKNGHAGVSCYSWGGGSTTYAMFVNLQNTAEIYWRDTNTNLTNTTTHPINVWVNSSIAVNNVYPGSSLGYTNSFYAQNANDLNFYGHNISFAAENTSWVQGAQSFQVTGQPGLPGSHLSVTTLPNPSGGDDLAVWYQTNGSDISLYTRDLVAGAWANIAIPIPQT